MKHLYPIIVLLGLLTAFVSCAQTKTDRTIISVTIEPQKYFADQLVDSLFEIQVIVPAGTSPETYDPSPVQMSELAKSTVYFKIGHIGFEDVWMDKIASNNPQLQIFDNSEGILLIDSKHDCGHDHTGEDNAAHHHDHAGVDPHTWSSPKKAMIIAENMAKALIIIDPNNEPTYLSNLDKLQKKIKHTDSIITDLLSKTKNKSFIIYHPALSYFCEDYGLKQFSIEIDGKEPSPDQLKELIETARTENIKTIFIQKEFDQKNAEIIAKETNCKLTVINPLSYEWDQEMIRIAQAIANE